MQGEKCLHGSHIGIGWLSDGHLDSADANRPNVALKVISILNNNFGCHPAWSANNGGSLGNRVRNLCANAEVGNFYVTVEIQQDVRTLQVAMDLAHLVQE